jgi:hypothetical protein
MEMLMYMVLAIMRSLIVVLVGAYFYVGFLVARESARLVALVVFQKPVELPPTDENTLLRPVGGSGG